MSYNLTTSETFKNWIDSNNASVNALAMYVEDVRELFLGFEWLQNCCIKKFAKFGGLDMEVLVNSSYMKSVTRNARKYAARRNSEHYNMEDDKRARVFLARRIFETCEYACR